MQLRNSSVLVMARGLLTRRLAALSEDQGDSFGPTHVVDIREPEGGCEGSTIALSDGRLLYSGEGRERERESWEERCGRRGEVVNE